MNTEWGISLLYLNYWNVELDNESRGTGEKQGWTVYESHKKQSHARLVQSDTLCYPDLLRGRVDLEALHLGKLYSSVYFGKIWK